MQQLVSRNYYKTQRLYACTNYKEKKTNNNLA